MWSWRDAFKNPLLLYKPLTSSTTMPPSFQLFHEWEHLSCFPGDPSTVLISPWPLLLIVPFSQVSENKGLPLTRQTPCYALNHSLKYSSLEQQHFLKFHIFCFSLSYPDANKSTSISKSPAIQHWLRTSCLGLNPGPVSSWASNLTQV